jgi:diguanylate cyclase (GGDEF)-like protein/PAS domain S-box-containing protein
MSDYRLSDLLDMAMLQKLADANFKAGGLPMTILDAIDSSVLVRAGWPDVCEELHNSKSFQFERCRDGHYHIMNNIGQIDAFQYRCKKGLWHIAIPIIVAGRHMGTMFLSHFLREDMVPERDQLMMQASQLGYEPDKYISAYEKLPVLSPDRVNYILSYDKALAGFIADIAEQSLRGDEKKKPLIESDGKYRSLIDNINIGLYRKSPALGRFIQVNKTMPKIFGYDSADEFLKVPMISLYQNSDDRKFFIDEINRCGFVKDLELALKKKDGSPIWCSVTASAHYDKRGTIKWLDSAIEDITERKKAEQELIKAHRELEIRVRERTSDLAQTNELLLAEIAQRKEAEKKLRELSEKDHLTMICNRRRLFELLRLEVEKSQRYNRPLSVIMFDLDHFKNVNDQYGHNIGDMVLKTTAVIVESVIRKTDIFARYGGEEFMILSPETTLEGAEALAEKIRASIEQHELPTVKKITISAGVAELSRKDSGAYLIEKADRALYAAKKNGRNRIETDLPSAES